MDWGICVKYSTHKVPLCPLIPILNIFYLYITSLLYIIHIDAYFQNLPAAIEVSGISWNALTSRDLSPSSVKYRAVVLQKPCMDRAMYFSLMNRAFTTHLAASSRSVKGTWGKDETERASFVGLF